MGDMISLNNEIQENKDNAIRNPMALSTVKSEAESRRIVKIMVFYSDNTFETYSLDKT